MVSTGHGTPHAFENGMSTDQSANRTTGETEGVEQQPTQAGEHDTTQRKQAEREGQAPISDPSKPQGTNEGLAGSPDATYGQAEGQAGTGSAGMPTDETNQDETNQGENTP
jgi:hypothetical protein